MKVGIVGAGAVGLTAGLKLASEGANVTIYEKSKTINEKASGSTPRAAGIAYGTYTSETDIQIADRSLEKFRSLSSKDNEFEFHQEDYIWFATQDDERRKESIRDEVEVMESRGRDVSILDSDELNERFPRLNTDDIDFGAVTEEAGFLDTTKYARVVAEKAREKGVKTRFGVEAMIETDPPRVVTEKREREFDAVLVSAGANTRNILSNAGIEIPLKPYRVQALKMQKVDVPMVYDATENYYFRPGPNFLLAGDGTREVEAHPRNWEREGDDWFVSELKKRLKNRIEGFNPHVRKAWAGLCTSTPDRDPLLGEIEDGIYVATGWQGHGFMRSPATGEVVAQQILSERDTIPEFDPQRFEGDEEFEVVQGMSIE